MNFPDESRGRCIGCVVPHRRGGRGKAVAAVLAVDGGLRQRQASHAAPKAMTRNSPKHFWSDGVGVVGHPSLPAAGHFIHERQRADARAVRARLI